MSGSNDRPARVAEKNGEEPFFSRWARLKKESREAVPAVKADVPELPAECAPEPGDDADSQAMAAPEVTQRPAEEPPELPPLESLTAESDFGAFMHPGVDSALRRAALRKMFSNPIYAVVDELDPFRADFAAFTPLGSTITSDMKFHAERLLREQLEKAAESAESDGTAVPETGETGPDEQRGQHASETAPDAAVAGDTDAGDDSMMPTENNDERRDF
jgi:hypothetical protein